MHLQDGDTSLVIGRVDHDLSIEPPWSQERRIEHVRPVRGRQHHDTFAARKAVHLGQDLIERLLTLVVTSERTRSAARAPDRVDLVDEDDGGSDLPRLRKKFAY